MKLFGSKKKSKHNHTQASPGATGSGKRGVGKRKKKNTLARVLVIILAILAALSVAAFAYWKTAVKPPDVSDRTKGSSSETGSAKDGKNGSKTSNGGKSGAGGKDGELIPDGEMPGDGNYDKYTFVILGKDKVGGGTDTIMVATFDDADYTLNVVSIPRDTLVNVSWTPKKANTLYKDSNPEAVKTAFSDLLGYTVDFYVVVDLDAFIKLVDGIGGVYYDVPQDMLYSDPEQNLYINVSKGPQTLNGKDAMGVVRFRHTYAEGDIKRISVQQDFLKAAVKQILENVSSVPITTLADIVVNDVKTDLEYGNIIWFAKEMMKMDAENVTFHTMPGNYYDSVNGDSYVTIYVSKWLEMINECLNPFDEPIEAGDLDILTRNSSGDLYATSGVRRGSSSWGAAKTSSDNTGTGSAATNGGSSTGSSGGTGTSSGTGNSTGVGTEPSDPSSGGTTEPESPNNTDEPGEPSENPEEPGENPGEGSEEPSENTEAPDEPAEPEEPVIGGEEQGEGENGSEEPTEPPTEETPPDTQEPEPPSDGGSEEGESGEQP